MSLDRLVKTVYHGLETCSLTSDKILKSPDSFSESVVDFARFYRLNYSDCLRSGEVNDKLRTSFFNIAGFLAENVSSPADKVYFLTGLMGGSSAVVGAVSGSRVLLAAGLLTVVGSAGLHYFSNYFTKQSLLYERSRVMSAPDDVWNFALDCLRRKDEVVNYKW